MTKILGLAIPGFSVGLPSLSPAEIPVEFRAGIMLRSHVGFAGDPTWDSRHFLPVESQSNFLWGMQYRYRDNFLTRENYSNEYETFRSFVSEMLRSIIRSHFQRHGPMFPLTNS